MVTNGVSWSVAGFFGNAVIGRRVKENNDADMGSTGAKMIAKELALEIVDSCTLSVLADQWIRLVDGE